MTEQSESHDERKHWDLCHSIVRVFFDVYNELGFGFYEIVYEEALTLTLIERGFSVARQVLTPIWFHGRKIGEYRADLVVNNAVLIELKSAQALDAAHRAQVLNYLRCTDFEVALLLNFGPKPAFKRLVFENSRKGIRVSSRVSAGS